MADFRNTSLTKKPQIKFRIGDGPEAPVRIVRGRDAWLLSQLIERGERGVTSLDNCGPRVSHYTMKLRRAGLAIETIKETHGGAYAGWHGRLVLRSPVTILEGIAE